MLVGNSHIGKTHSQSLQRGSRLQNSKGQQRFMHNVSFDENIQSIVQQALSSPLVSHSPKCNRILKNSQDPNRTPSAVSANVSTCSSKPTHKRNSTCSCINATPTLDSATKHQRKKSTCGDLYSFQSIVTSVNKQVERLKVSFHSTIPRG